MCDKPADRASDRWKLAATDSAKVVDQSGRRNVWREKIRGGEQMVGMAGVGEGSLATWMRLVAGEEEEEKKARRKEKK